MQALARQQRLDLTVCLTASESIFDLKDAFQPYLGCPAGTYPGYLEKVQEYLLLVNYIEITNLSKIKPENRCCSAKVAYSFGLRGYIQRFLQSIRRVLLKTPQQQPTPLKNSEVRTVPSNFLPFSREEIDRVIHNGPWRVPHFPYRRSSFQSLFQTSSS
ncbi:hypothetical protein KPH14_006379 [Odynerus spinipes]|uniref:Uncharacterized protein n=1 Tax=Odynerus spinipes TaxID=1348599 RepID=A0AAD9RZR4_9HYME|nr:hypothetical protein KPH14_006379 [Odynerus spinipes]